jgi:hypothetical protein
MGAELEVELEVKSQVKMGAELEVELKAKSQVR